MLLGHLFSAVRTEKMACVGGVDGVGRVFAAAVGHVGAVETAGTLPPYLLGRPLSHSIGFVLAKTKVVPAFCGKSVRILARSPAQVPRAQASPPSRQLGGDPTEWSKGRMGSSRTTAPASGAPAGFVSAPRQSPRAALLRRPPRSPVAGGENLILLQSPLHVAIVMCKMTPAK